MTHYCLGFDVGVSGACAIIESKSGELIDVFDFPTMKLTINKKTVNRISTVLLCQDLKDYGSHNSSAGVEKVSTMPKQGIVSNGVLMHSFGLIEGILAHAEITTTLIKPREWKSFFGLIGKEKNDSRFLAIQKWPAHAQKFKRALDHGRAEAALIAEFTRLSK